MGGRGQETLAFLVRGPRLPPRAPRHPRSRRGPAPSPPGSCRPERPRPTEATLPRPLLGAGRLARLCPDAPPPVTSGFPRAQQQGQAVLFVGCTHRWARVRTASSPNPSSLLTFDLRRVAPGNVRTRVAGWMRVETWSLLGRTSGPGADGSSPEATRPRPEVQHRRFKAHPAPSRCLL